MQSSSLDKEEVIRLHSWAIVNIKPEYTGCFKIPHPHLPTFEYQKFGGLLNLTLLSTNPTAHWVVTHFKRLHKIRIIVLYLYLEGSISTLFNTWKPVKINHSLCYTLKGFKFQLGLHVCKLHLCLLEAYIYRHLKQGGV